MGFAALAISISMPSIRADNYLVTNDADSGPGSLRQAMEDANANPGQDQITFSGSMSIQPLSALPPVTEALEIDGGGHSIDLNASGLNKGLEINSSHSIIRGLTVHSTNGSGIVVRPLFSTWDGVRHFLADPGADSASGMIAQADLFDSGIAGRWSYDHPIPGDGGVDYVFRATGTIDVAVEADYYFVLGSDDGGQVLIDGIEVVTRPFLSAFSESEGAIHLTPGSHDVEWIGFQHLGSAGFELSVSNTLATMFNLYVADSLIASPSALTASSLINSADLADNDSEPSPGEWPDDHPIPGGGGDDYAFQATGSLEVSQKGDYAFYLGSDDGGRLRIDGVEVVSFPITRSFGVSGGSIYLCAGSHSVEWTGFDRTGASGFELSVSGPDTGHERRLLGDPASPVVIMHEQSAR